MKILILTGRFGMGHVSAARAIAEQFSAAAEQLSDEGKPGGQEISVVTVDLVEHTLPQASRLIYDTFEFLARHGKSLYNFIYKEAGKRDENEWTAFVALCMKKLTQFMEEQGPDVVVSTLPLCSLLVSKYKERQQKKTGEESPITLITCITDISSHSEWIQPNTDLYLVGGELVKRRLADKGVQPEKIMVTGIPVGQAFLKNEDQESCESQKNQKARKNQKIHKNERPAERSLLIMGGGFGLLPRSTGFYEKLNAMEGVRTTVITGHNQKLYRAIAGRYANIEVLGYTKQAVQYMQRADVILTKPGGITLFEMICLGKPALFFAPTLQQEVNNMNFALHYHMGRVLPREQEQWAEQICDLMRDEAAIVDMTAGAKQLRSQYRKDRLRLLFTELLERSAG